MSNERQKSKAGKGSVISDFGFCFSLDIRALAFGFEL
jgi:hypothetical protein